MKQKKLRKLAITLMVLTAVPGQAFAESEKSRTSDTWLEAQLATTYTINRHLNPFEIETEVRDGVVYLSGVVDESIDKELAEEIAKSIDGVESVKNSIQVAKDQSAERKVSTTRGFADMVSDATITARVKSKLLWNKHTDGLDINVDTNSGVVTLEGSVEEEANKSLAEKLAENTSGVRRVENELVVKSSEARASLGTVDLDKAADNAEEAAEDVARGISDTWINTKIRSAFTFTRGLDADNISVSSKNGVVTLSGSAHTSAQKELAKEVAIDIRGVKKVVNNLSVSS